MKNSNHFQILPLLLLLCLASSSHLSHKIKTTKQIIEAYQHKLDLLLQLAKEHNITIQQDENYEQEQQQSIINQTTHQGGVLKSAYKNVEKSGIGNKLKEEYAFQVEEGVQFGKDTRYLESGYYVSDGKVIEAKSKKLVIEELEGNIVAIQLYQITTRINDTTIKLYKLGDKPSSQYQKLSISNMPGKWHNSKSSPNIFLQSSDNLLHLITPSSTISHPLPSLILQFHPIHPYKLLYITRSSYGYLNPKSRQILSSQNFTTIIENAYFYKPQNLIFVLFKNRTLTVVGGQRQGDKYGDMKGVVVGVGIDGAQVWYGHGWVIVGVGGIGCFQVYDFGVQGFKYNRQICLPNLDNIEQLTNKDIEYQFYKQNNTIKILANSQKFPKSKSYILSLQQKQHTSFSQSKFPWKIILVISGIIIVVIYRSRNKQNNEQSNEQILEKRRRMIRRGKKGKQNIKEGAREQWEREAEDQAGDDYVREVTNQLKKMGGKKLDPKKFD